MLYWVRRLSAGLSLQKKRVPPFARHSLLLSVGARQKPAPNVGGTLGASGSAFARHSLLLLVGARQKPAPNAAEPLAPFFLRGCPANRHTQTPLPTSNRNETEPQPCARSAHRPLILNSVWDKIRQGSR